MLGISVGTVKSQASRALATLRQDASRHTAMSGEEERMSNHDNLTEQLGRELHDRGASVPGHPIDLGDVKRTAGRIRRRRQVAGGAVVAAAAAIIVPACWWPATYSAATPRRSRRTRAPA